MAKVGLIRGIVLLFFCVSSTYGQKVKYKDLFGLLSSKQYEQAEPFLKRYLKDNDDNPNAFLFMGIIFQEKAGKNDVLKQTKIALANIDSALIFYAKAYATITEKEVKRNDEYYQAYNRRDLRTGEFGVKLSDIQFDLEKKKEALLERAGKIKMTKFYFTMADSLYKKSNQLYVGLQSKYKDETSLYLRYNEFLIQNLTALATRFDSCTKMFENYKSSIASLGKTGYNQKLTLAEINNFKTDGTSLTDFYGDDIQGWDYKKFALKVKETIEKEIVPMQANLITYDVEINKLRDKMNRDSVSVKSDLTKLISQLQLNQLNKFDPDPLPINIFNLKMSDLEYRSSLLEHKAFRDSTNVKFQVDLVNAEIKSLNKFDSIANKLDLVDLDERILNYEHFINNTFSNSIVLKSYIKALKEYGDREKRKKEKELSIRKEALKWLISGSDSIPLTIGVTGSKFKPLLIVDERYTVGLAYTDSLNATGYFYTIPSSHKMPLKASFPVEKSSFKLSRLPASRALSYSDPAGQIFFILIYSNKLNKENKYPVTIAKIYKSDGLAWNFNYTLPFTPVNLEFKTDVGELVIAGDTQKSTIDKNGKILK